MKYGYTVKRDGVFYPAGTEVPVGVFANPDEEVKQYSKSEISRMSTADLKELAPTIGIEVTEESTGAKLKEEIIAKLGL